VDTTVALNMPRRGPSGGGTNVYGATGGIVTRPTLAVIGEDGPEAVVPLNRTPGSSPLPGGVSGGGTINIYVSGLTGPQVADDIANKLMSLRRRNGKLPWE
jgi:hypothetical protein